MSDSIRVLAEVTLLSTLSTAEGGKSVPIQGSYRPNHNFFDETDAQMTIGFLEIPEGTVVNPGDSITLPIAFWAWSGLSGRIYPGRKWRIQEGAKLVGTGRIVEVLDPIP